MHPKQEAPDQWPWHANHPRLLFCEKGFVWLPTDSADDLRTITAIEIQKRDTERVNVFLDGQFAFGLAYQLATELTPGQQLTPNRIADLQRHDNVEMGKRKAVRLIGLRPRSMQEVKRNLAKKGYDQASIDAIVAHLQDADLLNDEGFARFWIEQRETFKPRGRRALRYELRLKGIAERIIELVLADVDETDAARRAAQGVAERWSKLPFPQFRAKLGPYLQRRGFDYETIRMIIDECWRSFSPDATDAS